jgi:hypothetical protein
MGGGKNAPDPPDYRALAEQTGESAERVTQQQTWANRPTQADAKYTLGFRQLDYGPGVRSDDRRERDAVAARRNADPGAAAIA